MQEGFYQLTTFVNGTGSPHLVQSAYFKADNGENDHNWNLTSHLEFGHQFRSNTTDFKLFHFAMYDRPLSSAEVEQNYNAGLPNNAPYVKDYLIEATEEICTPVYLNYTDYDTKLYESWTAFTFPGIIEPKSINTTIENIYISKLPDVSNGTLYFDSICSDEITDTYIATHNTSNLTELEIPEVIYFLSADDKIGLINASFSVWAYDGVDKGGITEFDINILPVNDKPISYDLDYDSTIGICTKIALDSNDVDGNDQIDRFYIDSSPSGTLYSDSSCTSTLSNNFPSDSYKDKIDIYYKIDSYAIPSGDYIGGYDTFTYHVRDIVGSDSDISTINITLINPLTPVANIHLNVNEDDHATIYLLGNDLSTDDNRLLTAYLSSTVNYGTLYDKGTNTTITIPTGQDYYEVSATSTCLYADSYMVPCIEYYASEDDYGTNLDTFNFTVKNVDNVLSYKSELVSITVINTPDAPILSCTDDVISNLKSGDDDIVDNVDIIISDVDLPNDFDIYYAKITIPSAKAKVSLPNGDDYKRCLNEAYCCDSECELTVVEGDVFRSDFPTYSTESEFYTSWRALKDILSNINIRAKNETVSGTGIISVYIEDDTGLNASCTIDYFVEEADAFDFNEGISEGIFTPAQRKIGYAAILLLFALLYNMLYSETKKDKKCT